MSHGSQSRLAVLVHADVVGSTVLVRKDERLAHDRIQALFGTFGDLIARYGGVVREIRGDALVAEFSRPSDAVLAALAAQTENVRRNSTLDDGVVPELRVGIALGEVVVADSTVTGAGIVMAQRLEQLASPGGVCISGAIREAVPDRLPIQYASLGDREVKGFDEPVRVFSVSVAEDEAIPAPELRASIWSVVSGNRRPLLTTGLLLALLATGGGFAWWKPWEAAPAPPAVQTVDPTRSEKPSIAVLPFNNLSNDPNQEYFSDGLTEDLITDLSRVSGLVVISRNSSFAYKGQLVNVQEVGRELRASHVLEGSVRRESGQVRINAQLTDARNGTQVWADRYDRNLTDVFALQDEVTRTIVRALAVNLSNEDRVRRERRAETSPDAYDMLLRGNQLLQRYNEQDMAEARIFYRKAIELDPKYARAHANLAFTHAIDLIFGWSKNRDESIRKSTVAIEEALALDDRIPQAHFSMSNVLVAQKRMLEAIAATRRAIEVDPNYADGYAQLAGNLSYLGKSDEALEAMATAMRLNPRYSAVYLWIQGRALFLLGRYNEAVATLQEAVTRNPGFDQPRLVLAASYASLGQQEDAEWEASEILALRPGFSVAAEGREKPFVRAQDAQRYLTGLRKAGLPE